MAYNLEEQENIDELKSWWKTYGSMIIMFIAVVVTGIAGSQAWKYYKAQQIDQAVELYDALLQVRGSGDPKKISDAAGLLMEGFPESGYASRAALISAQAGFDAGDTLNAKSRLQWVVDNASEGELRDLARLRLASVLLDEKKYDEAVRTLDSPHGESFDGLFADLKGDILAIAGKPEDARTAYQTALAKMGTQSNYRNIVQMKLDALSNSG